LYKESQKVVHITLILLSPIHILHIKQQSNQLKNKDTLFLVSFTVLLIISIAGIAYYLKKALQKTLSSET
jgi:predicted permease